MIKYFQASIVIFFAVVFSVSFIAALTTEVTVNYRPSQSMIARVIHPGTGEIMMAYYPRTNASGQANFSISSSLEQVDFQIVMVKDGEIVRTDEFLSKSMLEPIYINMLANVASPQATSGSVSDTNQGTSQTENVTQDIIQNTSQNANEVKTDQKTTETTGLAVSDTNSFKNISKKTYIIGAIILVVILVAVVISFIMSRKHKSGFSKGFGFGGGFGKEYYHDSKSPTILHNSREFAEAERKLKEATQEFENIKSKASRLIDAQKRFEEASRDLESLRRGL